MRDMDSKIRTEEDCLKEIELSKKELFSGNLILMNIKIGVLYSKVGDINFDNKDLNKGKENYLNSTEYFKNVLILDKKDIKSYNNLGNLYGKLSEINKKRRSLVKKKRVILKQYVFCNLL